MHSHEKRSAFNSLRGKFPLILVLFLGLLIGFFSAKEFFGKKKENGVYLIHMHDGGNGLTNPLIGVELPEGGNANLEAAILSIGDYMKSVYRNGKALNVAVYLRDLNSGTWVGIHQDDYFSAASLIKIPLMIVYLKLAEDDPAILYREIKYVNELTDQTPQDIAPKRSVQSGNNYAVDELLNLMIVYSDNIAYELLYRNLKNIYFIKKLYDELRLPPPDFKTGDYRITAKQCGRFFRTLYSVTYLNRAMSEKTLALLSKSDFREGIVAGVPAGITVAAKFAERKVTGLGGTQQLHDCGIVYNPENPYLLCVMTEGLNLDVLKGVIKDISRIAYEHLKRDVPYGAQGKNDIVQLK